MAPTQKAAKRNKATRGTQATEVKTIKTKAFKKLSIYDKAHDEV